MEQRVDLEIIGSPEDIKKVKDFLNVDKTKRSDIKNLTVDLFDIYEFPNSSNSLCYGYTDSELDKDLDRLYADDSVSANHIYFKSYRSNLFKFAQFLSETFLSCQFKISWIEKVEGVETLFVFLVEKSCCLYYQTGKAYTLIAPNYNDFIKENNLEKFVENHTRFE